jgi:hypothetical protein
MGLFPHFLSNQTDQKWKLEKKREGKKNKRLTLRIAQLFQISWPRISSTVGNLMGSIGGLSASFGLEGPFVDSFPVSEAMDVAWIGSGNWHNSKNARAFVCAREERWWRWWVTEALWPRHQWSTEVVRKGKRHRGRKGRSGKGKKIVKKQMAWRKLEPNLEMDSEITYFGERMKSLMQRWFSKISPKFG